MNLGLLPVARGRSNAPHTSSTRHNKRLSNEQSGIMLGYTVKHVHQHMKRDSIRDSLWRSFL